MSEKCLRSLSPAGQGESGGPEEGGEVDMQGNKCRKKYISKRAMFG